MREILSKSNRAVLKEFVCSNVLIAFDYDGTLAPIVKDPARAVMRTRTRNLLCDLTRRLPVVVISGRAQGDTLKMLRGVGVYEVIGNHGMEPWHASSHYIGEVQQWRAVLETAIAPYKGLTIEDKTYSLAVHYRQSREKKKARAAILRAANELSGVRVIGGKQVVNILPYGAPHKGVALEKERARLQCDTAIYVGDDVTDEDVFSLDQPGRLLTIRIGKKRESAAAYYLANQVAIDEFLAALVAYHREAHSRAAPVP
jgi:trehalose 6-phosphate phosphatase